MALYYHLMLLYRR